MNGSWRNPTSKNMLSILLFRGCTHKKLHLQKKERRKWGGNVVSLTSTSVGFCPALRIAYCNSCATHFHIPLSFKKHCILNIEISVFTVFQTSENSFEQQFSGEHWSAAEESWGRKRRNSAAAAGPSFSAGSTDSSEEMKILFIYCHNDDYDHD